MKFFTKFLISFLLISLCVACSHKPAKIVNRSKVVYNKNNGLNKEKYRDIARENSVEKQTIPAEKKSINHEVEIIAGDTLYSISKKHQVTLRDLIKQNNLIPPYNLKSGSKLTIPVSTYHEVKTGDTLYGISRLYNMKVDNLIEMNDLKEPYSVKVGEKIRVSKLEAAQVQQTNDATKITEKKSEVEVGFVEKTLDKLSHFSWPVRGKIISKFGPKSGGLYNDGINIKAREGEAVKASESGVVAYVGNELKGYGNLVIIKHSGGWITAYAHLKETAVKRGQKITKGEKIGSVGATGNVSSPQLYFGLRKGRDAVNPENYLK